ncbi:type II secretion system protein [bacterium]|nr:type II secretion system protein [bacterium]
MYHKFNRAFSLAETLIALVIIGVVAAITIMVLIPDTKGKERIVKLQRAYSILANAYENTATKFGPIIDWGTINSESFGYTIGNSMRVAKNCSTATDLTTINDCIPGCPKIYTTAKNLLDVCTSGNVAKLMTDDGFSYAFQIESSSCDINVTDNSEKANSALKQVCGTAMTDIFSTKKGNNKNLYGVDLFLFYITRDGIYPAGIEDDTKFKTNEPSKCKKIMTENIPGCTAVFLYDKTKVEE